MITFLFDCSKGDLKKKKKGYWWREDLTFDGIQKLPFFKIVLVLSNLDLIGHIWSFIDLQILQIILAFKINLILINTLQ